MNTFMGVGWTWYPSVVIGLSLWTVFYTLAIQKNRHKPTSPAQQIAFHCGTLLGLLALVSPLDELGDEYLFSAHMVQHLLLMFGVAPLWLIGTPGWLVEAITPQRLTKQVTWLTNPLSALVAFVGVMWLWHIPFMFEMAQENEAVHILEHLTFIGAALLGWWPVAGADTIQIPKPVPPVRILYLVLLTVPCTALAAILTFARKPLYPFYVTATHQLGLDALQDQHLGGLLMWLPTHMIILLAIGITFLKWFVASDRRPEYKYVRPLS